jgi:class 3 adenylate cyclase
MTIKKRSPAYFLVEKDGRLIDCGGKLSAYGIEGLEKGVPIGSQVLFLDSLFPLDNDPLFLSCVKAESGLSADIHIFPGDKGDWILLLDARSEEIRRCLLQQKSNELSLLREKVSKILDLYVRKGFTEKPLQGVLSFQESGERRDVSILFVDIRGFTWYSEGSPPQVTLQTLNQYLSTMTQPILDEAGLLDRIIGDVSMAIFGVLPTTGSFPDQAIRAALKVIENVHDLNKIRKMDNQSTFDVAIGIASGQVTLGIFGSKGCRAFSAVGQAVKRAADLERQARPGQIVIDENTFKKTKNFQNFFSGTTLRLKGIDRPVQAFSCEVK